MEGEVLKPFPCKELDCGMSFFTEDHLSVHYQAKHNKLNLEIPKGTNTIFGEKELETVERSNVYQLILADQTPTPTRLLNNCEELRVFDDLQNINPFEEGFRRAVEDISGRDNSFLQIPSNHQDTLHTPQILPQFENRPMKKEPNPEIPTQDEPENLTIPSTPEDSSNIPKLFRQAEPSANDLKISQKPPITLLPKPNIIYAAASIGAQATIRLLESDVNKSNESVKDKLKNIILNNSGSQIDKKRIKSEPVSTIYIGTVPLVARTTGLIISSDNNTNNFNISNDEVTPPNHFEVKSNDNGSVSRKRVRGEKSEASTLKVERNRAAARRYR